MKISKNAPCSCGSGKKYKNCCGADAPPFDGSTKNDNWDEQVSQAINDNGGSTFEETTSIEEQIRIIRKAHTLPGFLGLSTTQMTNMLYEPFESPELFTFNEKWLPKNSKALQLFVAIAAGIGKDGINATSRGNLPIKLCRDILANTPENLNMDPLRISSETDYQDLHVIRLVGQMAGLIKKRKSRFSLTKLGHELMQPERKAQLFHNLFKTYAMKFNWAFRDGYPDASIIQTCWLFSLYSLSLFGSQWRPSYFYSNKLLEAFPKIIYEFEERPYSTMEKQFHYCFQIRTLLRFAKFWGVIEVHETKSPNSLMHEYQIQAPYLSSLLQFHV